MDDIKTQYERDKVTVGQLRARQLRLLETQIAQLGTMIRQGYHNRSKAEAFLKDDVGRTLTVLDNINSLASTEILFPET